ncbi:MAG: hypothetical protein IPJ56_11775 [Gemmatimonadetes bacterium]|nr:hypothetical protein [Gemmatimonadota bacterium]
MLKATYWMTGRFDVDLRLDAASDNVVVAIAGLDGPLEPHLSREVEIRLRRDLIDFRTRAVIEAETRTLREILVAKAFDDDGDA